MEKGDAMEAAQGSAHIGRIRLIVLTASVVAAVYIVLEMMLSPLTSARSAGYLLLFVSAAIAVNTSVGLFFQAMHDRIRRWLRILMHLFLTLLIPLFLIPLVEHMMQGRVLQVVEDELAPIIASIDAYAQDNRALPAGIDDVHLNAIGIARVSYYREGSHYALAALVPAMDMDGETIYYDSLTRSWARVHNDILNYYGDRDDAPDAVRGYRALQKMPVTVYTRMSLGHWSSQEGQR